jgi:ribosomal protein S18 acetylase RimI-like enzyme
MEQRLAPFLELGGEEISLRLQTEADEPFLKELYASVRWPELATTGWPDGLKHAFLEQQRALQTQHYVGHYANLWRGITLCAGSLAGRMYLWQNGDDIRIVDLALLPQYRNQGIGTRLLRAVIAEARRTGTRVSLHVDEVNRARLLYQKLGFRPEGNATPPHIFMTCQP